MSDIFISYASADRDRVLPLVNGLKKTGWSVFWDRTIPAGRTWRQVIGSEIQRCRSVVVVWTEKSIMSEWVHEEAETGKRKRILIPVLLDNIEPPFGFGSIQGANLVVWNGDYSSPTFTRLIADIASILGPTPAAVKAQRKSPAAPQDAWERQDVSVPKRLTGSNRRQQLYATGAVVIVIAVMAVWFLGPSGSKDADVKRIVSLGIQGKRQLNVGEKILLRVGGRFADGTETDVVKNLDWHSSDDAVVAVSQDGQVEARKDGFADITVHYEGITSPPLTLMVRGESRATEPDAARIATQVQEHIKTAGFHRDRGEYSTALAELAKAKSLDASNKAVQAELERTKKACLAEQKIGLTKLSCE